MNDDTMTPGPWVQDRTWHDTIFIKAPNALNENGFPSTVVMVPVTRDEIKRTDNVTTTTKIPLPMAEANARAICALPELIGALEVVLADILDYERVNNLAPNPGRADCWQSVTRARAILAKIKGA